MVFLNISYSNFVPDTMYQLLWNIPKSMINN